MELSLSHLTHVCQTTPERAEWLARLPDAVAELLLRWSLTLRSQLDEGEASCSWVALVTLPDGTPAVLKLGMPHMEGEQEIAGLRFWEGNPTVHLLEADEHMGAMLLELCRPGTLLRTLPEPEQDLVMAALLRRLWRLPSSPHTFRPLRTMTAYWTKETIARAGQWHDAGLVRHGLDLFDELSRSGGRRALLATDLHAGNVLRAQREEWLVIDPKPFVGDPAYDATQHLLNCVARLLAAPDRMIRGFADMLEVSHERVRLWLFARAAAEPRDDWGNVEALTLARALAP